LVRSYTKGAFAFKRILPLTLVALAAAVLLRGALYAKRDIALEPVRTIFAEEASAIEKTQTSDADNSISYSLFCPDTLLGDEYIALYLIHQQAEIYLENRLVYRSEGEEAGYAVCFPEHYWALVPLQKGDAGKQIHIHIRNNSVDPTLRAIAAEPTVYIADKSSILLTVIWKESWSLIVGSLSIAIGFFIFLIPFLGRGGKEGKPSSTLGLFLAVSGLFHVLSLSRFALLAYVQNSGVGLAFLTAASWVCYSLIPVLYLMFLRLEYDDVHSYRVAVVLTEIATIVLFLLALFDVQTFLAYILFTYALRAIVFAVFVVQVILLFKNGKNHAHTGWIARLSMGILLFQMVDIITQHGNGRIDFHMIAMLYSLIYTLVYSAIRARDAFHRQEQLHQAEKTIQDQKIRILSDQIRPHFIYNTMNTIYALCDQDVEAAKQTIHDFTRFLRSRIDSLEQNAIPFSEELDRVRYYLSIEEQRFQGALSVRYCITETDFKLPPLSLQPLVENAVRHGILPKNAPGTVTIGTKQTDEEWLVTVEDDGIGFDPANLSADDGRPHLGIENVRSRLLLMGNGFLTLESRIGKGTKATIHLPKEK